MLEASKLRRAECTHTCIHTPFNGFCILVHKNSQAPAEASPSAGRNRQHLPSWPVLLSTFSVPCINDELTSCLFQRQQDIATEWPFSTQLPVFKKAIKTSHFWDDHPCQFVAVVRKSQNLFQSFNSLLSLTISKTHKTVKTAYQLQSTLNHLPPIKTKKSNISLDKMFQR